VPMYDADEIVELKNRKKRRKRLIKLLIFLLISLIALGLYHYRGEWLPKLQGLGKHYQTIRNSGRLAEGNFPIEINGGAEYQFEYSEDTLFRLSDAYIYYYNTDGGQLKKRQHAFTNSVLNVAGENALIFESGGNELVVETQDNILYSKQMENTIIFARISKEAYTAVVTTSDNYACQLTVYNNKGENIYQRNCVERINDISFTGDSEGCVLSYLGAENGTLVTSVQKIDFSDENELWTSPGINTFGLETYSANSGAFVLGYSSCAYVDKNGEITSFYEYDGDLAGGDSKGGKSAVIINDDERRKYTMVLFDKEDETPITIEFDDPLEYVTVYDGLAYVMSKESLCAYDFSGNLRSTADVSDSCTQFRRSSDYIFLMSYNRVDRIDYNS